MDVAKFASESNKFLGRLLNGTSFDLETQFSKITEPVTLGGRRFQIYCFKSLTGYRPNKDRSEPVLYTFFLPFVPDFGEFKELRFNLGRMLENDYFPGKGYKFAFHLAVPTKDLDMVGVFLETNSVARLQEAYPGDLVFDPTT